MTTRAEANLGKIVVSLYKEQKNHDVRYFIAEASKRWYAMLAQDDAVYPSGLNWRRELALGPIIQIITTLAAALNDMTKTKPVADVNESVETLIWRPFQTLFNSGQRLARNTGAWPTACVEYFRRRRASFRLLPTPSSKRKILGNKGGETLPIMGLIVPYFTLFCY